MLTESPSILELLGKGASLEKFARYAAQQMIALAMEAEIAAAIEQYQFIKTSDGKAAVVRTGYYGFPPAGYSMTGKPRFDQTDCRSKTALSTTRELSITNYSPGTAW
jgi:hypothetical protein